MLEVIADGLAIVTPPLGAGTEVEVRADGLTGAGVYYEEYLAHLSVFANRAYI